MRLDIERQNKLEPIRVKHAKGRIIALGYKITWDGDNRLDFLFKGNTISYYPYSGWASGKGIKDGRGLNNLLNQIKEK